MRERHTAREARLARERQKVGPYTGTHLTASHTLLPEKASLPRPFRAFAASFLSATQERTTPSLFVRRPSMAAAFSAEPGMLHRRLSGRSTALEALVGGTASAVASVFSNPIDIVRVRMQLGGIAPTVPLHAGLGPAMAYNVRAMRP